MIRPDPADAHPQSLADLFEAGLATVHPRAMRGAGHRSSPGHPSAGWPEVLEAVIADGYDPVLRLDPGSTAETWRCVDRSFGREVVVKVIRPDAATSPEEAETLLRCEAEILGKLRHPGIVHAVRRGGTGDQSYLALDFVDGDPLFEHCDQCHLDAGERLRLFARWVEAVAYLHEKGVVHGDLKPEHILVCEGGHPVLIDFGLAARHQYTERLVAFSGRIGGSGRYRAPEIVDGSAHQVEPAQDVYALGEVLRGLLDGVDEGDLHPQVRPIIHRATASLPEERWPDAGALQVALRDVLAPSKPLASPPARKSTLAGWLAMAVALVLAAFGGTAWVIGSRPDTGLVDSTRSEVRGPVALSARAGLLEGVAAHLRDGQAAQAGSALEALLAQEPEAESAWEVCHLRAGIAGQGVVSPFGDAPYQDPFTIDVAYDPQSQAIAYLRSDDNGFGLWVRTADQTPRLVGTTPHAVHAVALSPRAGQIATLETREGGHRVVLWPTTPGTDPVTRELPHLFDIRRMWYSQDGETLYVFSPEARTVACWSTTAPQAFEPEQVFRECDHAYPLPSGGGCFIVATRGSHRAHGLTHLRLISPEGDVLREVDLEDGQLPVCADTDASADGLICFGMTDGHVRIHAPTPGHDSENRKGRWLASCDLGRNAPVLAVVYRSHEGRIFAGVTRVHVIDAAGQLIMRLGDYDHPRQLIVGLYYDKNTRTLTSLSIQRIRQWLAPTPTE